MVEDRFKRLNRLICGFENEENGLFGSIKKNGGFFKPEVPLELRDNFNIKRIDHRHHALDAIVIACATRKHVNYINNNHAKSDLKRFDLGRILRNTKKIEKTDILTGEKTEHVVLDDYKKPWDNFTGEAKLSLQQIVISVLIGDTKMKTGNLNMAKMVKRKNKGLSRVMERRIGLFESLYTKKPFLVLSNMVSIEGI